MLRALVSRRAVGALLCARLSRAAASAALVLPVPVLGGDWPDPSVIRDDEGYAAVTTSSGWAPAFRVLRSTDLRGWRIAGSAFRRAPRWARGALWAPELTRLGDGYAIFYSALPRRRWWERATGLAGSGRAAAGTARAAAANARPSYCLGVATAPAAVGPYRDSGRPLRCGRDGSIDPHPARDERGRLHLLWKEDGNRFRRPTAILAQPLSADGRRLTGRPRAVIRNGGGWEGRVVEAPTVIRREGFFYLFYSANLCCTSRCAYAVGVARSPTLLGRWQRFPGNPILRGGNGWRCPGHVSVVAADAGGYKALFHAYRTGAGLLSGRQLLADDVTFGRDGWPRIGTGVPAAPLAGTASTAFSDAFPGPRLAPEWEWPIERVPGIRVGGGGAAGGLELKAAPEGGARVDAGVLSRRVGTDRYVATAVVDRGRLRGGAVGGLASFQSGSVAIGVAAGRRKLIAWRRRKGAYRLLARADPPAGRSVHLMLTSRGRTISFAFSGDGQTWTPLGGEQQTPVEETARLALTAGGSRRAVARFSRAELSEAAP